MSETRTVTMEVAQWDWLEATVNYEKDTSHLQAETLRGIKQDPAAAQSDADAAFAQSILDALRGTP